MLYVHIFEHQEYTFVPTGSVISLDHLITTLPTEVLAISNRVMTATSSAKYTSDLK